MAPRWLQWAVPHEWLRSTELLVAGLECCARERLVEASSGRPLVDQPGAVPLLVCWGRLAAQDQIVQDQVVLAMAVQHWFG